ncbi:MAG: RelA/SpoT family protein [Bacteroidia bacterium]
MKSPKLDHEMQLSPEGFEKKILQEYNRLVQSMRGTPSNEMKEVRRAFYYAKEAHKTMHRKSGEPYILHPIAVAQIVVSEMGLFSASVICALLHDVVEDTDYSLDDIHREFGREVRDIVDGLTKITKIENVENASPQAENYRRILLTISHDIRVILIKIADRLHNMRTMEAMPEHKRFKIASETFYLYAPLAYRLGLYSIKSELEDLSFKFLQPNDYQEIEQRITESKDEALAYIERFKQTIHQQISSHSFPFQHEIKSRFKSIYSIYNKIKNKGVSFEEVYDLYAIRIIVESRPGREIEDCWTIYSLIAGIYGTHNQRLRNWLQYPKENGYQALHVTVLGPSAKWVEIQIRTTRMDEIAEKGISAHWRYKGESSFEDDFAEWIEEAKKILVNPDFNALEAVKAFRQNMQVSHIYVLSPKGDMIRIASNATALDFGYKIHSRVGEAALAAKINGKTVPLETNLEPGDQVEIITSKKVLPQPEWLKMVKTPKAIDSIKESLNRQRKGKIEEGKEIFERALERFRVTDSTQITKELLTYVKFPTKEDFFVALADNQVNREKIQEFIRLKKEGKKLPLYNDDLKKEEGLSIKEDKLVLGKTFDIKEYKLSSCCSPLPGDDIYAFLVGDNSVYIHTTGCEQTVPLLANHGEKVIKAAWNQGDNTISYLVALKVEGADRKSMLIDLLKVISNQMQLNMRKVTIDSKNKYFEGLFLIYVKNKDELDVLIKKLKKVPNVNHVSRTDSNFEPFQE